ncbi:MAG: IMPACT family protein [Calditrichia bacterium]
MTTEKTFTIAKPLRHELKIKRSSFIGSIAPAENKDSAEDYIQTIRTEFQDASHNCFGYRIDRHVFRYYDDGEPASTAGRPILAMIDKYALLKSAVVVTRYFGGTKLGIGGLISAYSQCAEETILRAEKIELIDYQYYKLTYSYKLARQIEYIVAQYQGDISKSDYQAAVTSHLRIPSAERERFEKELTNTGSGRIDINPLEG